MDVIHHLMREERKLKCISFFGSLHVSFCSNKQMLRAFKPSYTTEIFLLLQILHAIIPMFVSNYMTCPILIFSMHVSNEGFTF